MVGTVTALFAAYAAWTGLSYLGKVGGGVRMTAYLPTSGDSLGPASNVKYHGLVVGRVDHHHRRGRQEPAPRSCSSPTRPTDPGQRDRPGAARDDLRLGVRRPGRPRATRRPRRLPSVHTIPADRSAETLRIMDAVAAGERILRAVDPSQLDATASALADLLDDNGENVGRFIERASDYLGTMLPHSDALYRDLRLLGQRDPGRRRRRAAPGRRAAQQPQHPAAGGRPAAHASTR